MEPISMAKVEPRHIAFLQISVMDELDLLKKAAQVASYDSGGGYNTAGLWFNPLRNDQDWARMLFAMVLKYDMCFDFCQSSYCIEMWAQTGRDDDGVVRAILSNNGFDIDDFDQFMRFAVVQFAAMIYDKENEK